MAKGFVHIDPTQIKALRADINTRQHELVTNLKVAADEVLLNTEADAKALSPRDSGRLEQSIHSSNASYHMGKISGVVGSNLVYALRRHEEKPRIGTYHKYDHHVRYDNYYYNGRGELTRAKPNVGEFSPGRKYLENAQTLNQENWKNHLQKAVKRTYKGLG
ncbi:HK97 gp10 family phage protein [Staphylococcus pettenkoferi]|uniref:HK97 gp10 family phage protein n=1 Tax=Staphylococcus pettenkoferi TaxID=170573 RepID=A0ABT4BL00_9STAP|nr:HK97 gp10 family phage protein [Staphylococcus pettenkoferi]MCY1563818.1 HK97 gp10 family phage protein [Staphylococcus pettenkoferi]MCY1583351.1 HK97 gp10 family phage protein [Staphylococcus pettenkoferi]